MLDPSLLTIRTTLKSLATSCYRSSTLEIHFCESQGVRLEAQVTLGFSVVRRSPSISAVKDTYERVGGGEPGLQAQINIFIRLSQSNSLRMTLYARSHYTTRSIAADTRVPAEIGSRSRSRPTSHSVEYVARYSAKPVLYKYVNMPLMDVASSANGTDVFRRISPSRRSSSQLPTGNFAFTTAINTAAALRPLTPSIFDGGQK